MGKRNVAASLLNLRVRQLHVPVRLGLNDVNIRFAGVRTQRITRRWEHKKIKSSERKQNGRRVHYECNSWAQSSQ